MSQKHTKRASSHPWIQTVWQTMCLTDGVYRSTPDGCWDLILAARPDGTNFVFLTGQQTEPIDSPYVAGEHSVVISFAPHVHLTRESQAKSGSMMRFLPVADGNFTLDSHTFPLPTFHQAEELVDRMIGANLLRSDDLVARAFTDNPKAASERTVQQRFKKVTGITQKNFQLIGRAQEAVRRLKAGEKPAAVAADLGYTDQPHMIKSIKKIMGSLPSDLEAVHKI